MSSRPSWVPYGDPQKSQSGSQWVKVLVVKFDDVRFSLVSGTHAVKELDSRKMFRGLHLHFRSQSSGGMTVLGHF